MEISSGREITLKILRSHCYVHVETAIKLAGDRVKEVAFGTAYAMASRDVQYPKRHERRS